MTIDGRIISLEHFNVLARKGEGDKSFLLYAHMDTVPPVGAWKKMGLDPYIPREAEGRLYGLGSSDMKGGIAAILSAIGNLAPRGYVLKVAFGVDEENESMGAHLLAGSDFISDCAGCIVPEVGSGNATPSPRNIIIGRHGRSRTGIRVTGRAAHASTPEHIINPVEYALSAIDEVKKIDLGNDPDMPEPNVSIGGIQAMGGGLSSPEDCIIWFDNIFSPPKTVARVLNDYRATCRNLEEKHQNPETGLPRFEVIDPGEKTGEPLEYNLRTTPFMEPWKMDPSHRLVDCARDAVRRVTGEEGILTWGKSNADENYLGQVIPTVVIPPVGGNEHQGGEYVEIESLTLCQRIITDTVSLYMERKTMGI